MLRNCDKFIERQTYVPFHGTAAERRMQTLCVCGLGIDKFVWFQLLRNCDKFIERQTYVPFHGTAAERRMQTLCVCGLGIDKFVWFQLLRNCDKFIERQTLIAIAVKLLCSFTMLRIVGSGII